jgi:arylsulfatase A-like enzyme
MRSVGVCGIVWRVVCVVVALGAVLAAAGCRSSSPKTIVLVIVDTLRTDHVSAYGYDRDTTPTLDAIAAEGERYTSAFAQSSWTLPTISTLLTGQPPHVHGAGRTDAGVAPIQAAVPTVAERLRDAGLATGAFVNVVWLNPASGAARGFDSYDFETTDGTNRRMRDAATTTDAAIRWIEKHKEQPFFLAVHYFDPHLTYDPPAPYDTMFVPEDGAPLPPTFGSAQEVFAVRSGQRELSDAERATLIGRYDGEIRYVDDQIARVRRKLESIGRWDDALIVVVADHGEEFWDHGGFEHGHSHYDEMIRIPLIVRDPARLGAGVNDGRVRQLDVAPTLVAFAGADASGLPGTPLGAHDADYSVAEGSLWAGDLLSIRGDAGSLILDRGTDAAIAFGPADARQQSPLPGTGAEAQQMLGLLRALPPAPEPGAAEWQPSAEQLERLRSLGYVQ